MKTFLLFLIFGFLACSVFGQGMEKIGGTSVNSISKVGSVPLNTAAGIGNAIAPGSYANCKEIKDNNPAVVDGLYNIDPDGTGPVNPFDCYCDMTTDGGGWTLVLLNNSSITGCPGPNWSDAVNLINLKGSLSSDITSFDLLVGLRFWELLGTQARLEMGLSPSSLSHRAYYSLSLDETNYYKLVMTDESITINAGGTASPGMYTYHNNRSFSTYDVDHDGSSSNCSQLYNKAPWWYGNCWSGSFWGGGGAVYQDAPYWTGTGTEYFSYGSIWLR